MKSRCLVLILAPMLWMALINSAAANDPESRIYGMTATEAQEVVTEWLKNNEFEVFNQSSSDQSIDLVAEKKQQQLRVVARKHSPLAARIQRSNRSGLSPQSPWRSAGGTLAFGATCPSGPSGRCLRP